MGQVVEKIFRDELDQFERNVDRILNSFLPQQQRFRPVNWHPPTDVFETDQAVVVKVEIGGMKPEDFEIHYVGHVLTVRGDRRDSDENKRGVHLLEIAYGEFQIEIHLPGTHVETQIDAKYDNGFLYVRLPKPKEQTYTAVRINVK